MRAQAKNTKHIFIQMFRSQLVNPFNTSAASFRLVLLARPSRRESHYPVISTSRQWCVLTNQFKPCSLRCGTSGRRQLQSLSIRVHALFAIHKLNTSHVHSLVPVRSCLTSHSTGPIVACRHLGYKSLAQMPPRHNGPVSSNVRHLNP